MARLPPHPGTHHNGSVQGSLGSLHLGFHASFSAPWTVLFGPSGCGKSSILRGLCGLTEGLCVQFTRTVTGDVPEILQGAATFVPPARRRLGYAPQSAGLFPHLSVERNIDFGARVRGDEPRHRELAEEALALFGLEKLRHRLPRELSGGERQRVSLARALAVPDTRLLLLDEPFAGIDRGQRDTLLSGIAEWARRAAIPVISVTHDVDEVFLLAAEVIRLHEGATVAQGRPEEVLGDEVERVQRAFRTRD